MSSKPSVTLTIAGDADRLSRATQQATRSVDDLEKGVTKSADAVGTATERQSGRMSAAMGVAAGAIGAFAVTGASHLFELSKSMEALDVKAQTVFQDQLPSVKAWAEENRKAFGDSTRNVVAMAANLADLLKPMGFTTAQAADMSKKILDLSGALSRWSGGTKTAAEVSEILADAMLGETDGLKALGISISAAEVEAKALSMGLGKTTVDMIKVKEATFAVKDAQDKLNKSIKDHGQGSDEARRASLALEKAQGGLKDAMAGGKTEIDQQATALATQQLILEKSADAQAAWANGGREAAEAQNGLSSTMAESAEKLATIVAPVFERLVSILGAVAEWASRNQVAAIVIVGVTAAVWLLNAALNANPIILIVTLIAALIVALVLLWTKSEGFRSAVTGVWESITGSISSAADSITRVWNRVVDFFANLPGRIGRAMGTLGEIISNVFKGAVNIAIEGINWLIRRANDLIYRANVINPFSNIPYIPQIPRLHTGGIVPGPPGTETMIMARAGERVDSGAGSSGQIELVAVGSGGVADFINALIADGQLEARFR